MLILVTCGYKGSKIDELNVGQHKDEGIAIVFKAIRESGKTLESILVA